MNHQLPDDLETGYSRPRMLRLVALGVIMTLLSASVTFNWYASKSIDGFHVVIGYVGIALFGLATLKFLWTLITARGAVVFIGRDGIRDTRVANELIHWDSIEAITAGEVRRQKFIVLKVSPALEQRLFATTTKRALQLANRAMGVDGVTISASGLTMDFDALLEACMARYSAAARSRAHRQAGTMSAPLI